MKLVIMFDSTCNLIIAAHVFKLVSILKVIPRDLRGQIRRWI